MVAGAILPACIHNGELLFLFGLENEKEVDAKGWSDFGGGCEKNETPYQTAIREGREETSGFLIPKELVKQGVFKMVHDTYHIFVVKMQYDMNICKYFNRAHEFVKEKKPDLLGTVFFEKQKIEWFSIKDIVHRRGEFREFYQEITDMIISNEEKIKKFVRSKKTRKV
jgi:8-oxo-dGTP pyrophosphatase MutT (NUDIX family)